MEEVAYKFTPSFYRTTNVTPAYDLNLRRDHGGQMAWIGFYQRSNEFQQLRLGYENTWTLPFVKVTPSLQYATRGFLGGSLTGEIGERYFALVGFGRTNLKDYFNLNFDPNDMVMFGFGTRALPNTTLSLFQIRDDRLGTGQHISHLVTRIKPDEKNRWTVDVFYKEGRADADPASVWVHGTGVTLTWDYGRYFARVASDPVRKFFEQSHGEGGGRVQVLSVSFSQWRRRNERSQDYWNRADRSGRAGSGVWRFHLHQGNP